MKKNLRHPALQNGAPKRRQVGLVGVRLHVHQVDGDEHGDLRRRRINK